MVALQRFQVASVAEVARRNLEKELTDLIRRSQADRAERERLRDLVPYSEVLSEFGREIADREARPPVEHRQRVDAAVAKLFADIGYAPDTGRPHEGQGDVGSEGGLRQSQAGFASSGLTSARIRCRISARSLPPSRSATS